jgi:hypothetical protein
MLSGIVHSHEDVQRFFNVNNHTETLNIKVFDILTYVLSYFDTKELIHKNTIYQIQESLMDRLGVYPLVMFSIYIQHISMLDGVHPAQDQYLIISYVHTGMPPLTCYLVTLSILVQVN